MNIFQRLRLRRRERNSRFHGHRVPSYIELLFFTFFHCLIAIPVRELQNVCVCSHVSEKTFEVAREILTNSA